MFNIQGSEIIVILLLALVILGPEKLPDAIRKFGRTYAELKKMASGFQEEFKSVLDEPARELRETADLLRQSVDLGELSGDKPHSPGGPAEMTGDATGPDGDATGEPAVRAGDDPPHGEPTFDLPFTAASDPPDEVEPEAVDGTDDPAVEPVADDVLASGDHHDSADDDHDEQPGEARTA